MKYTLINKFIQKIIKILIVLLLNEFILNVHNNNCNIKVCLCTCGKNENKYAREFVEHYHKYGVDKIFIYDNNDNNGENFYEVLSDYIKSGFVEVINFRGKLKKQMETINVCYQYFKNDYDWFIFYDMDEFIHLYNFKNIKKYLCSEIFKKCNIIYLNHVIHTDNNQIYYRNSSLFERFPKIENFKNVNYAYQPRKVLKDITKIIIRGNFSGIKFVTMHFLDNKIKNSCNGFGKIITHKNIHLHQPDHNNYFIDHFYFKSSEEYLNKLEKGDAYYGVKRGFGMYWFQIYFAFNKITKEKLDYFENKTGTNLTFFRNKISKNIKVN